MKSSITPLATPDASPAPPAHRRFASRPIASASAQVHSPRPAGLGLGSKTATALLISVLFFARQIAHFADPNTRAMTPPPPYFRAAILLDVAILTAVGVGVAVLLQRLGTPRWRRTFGHLFVLAFGSEVLSVAPVIASGPALSMGAWLAFAAAVAFALATGRDGLFRVTRSVALTFSPAAPLILVPMAFWDTPRPTAVVPIPPPAARAGLPPVVVLLFDEWGYSRSVTPTGDWLPSLPNIRKLSAGAFHFREARSASLFTDESVPQIAFETSDRLVVRRGEFHFSGLSDVPVTSATPNLFGKARAAGYETRVVGWHVPYHTLFAGQLDEVHLAPNWPGLPGFEGSMAFALAANLRYSYNPVIRALQRPVYLREFAMRVHDVDGHAGRALATCAPGTFTFVHSPAPHFPMIFRPDGSHNALSIGSDGPAYLDQLAYADALLGRMLDRLRASGHYDDALIVVTSDHGWREDPDPSFTRDPRRVHRVPLVVKWPGQTGGHVVDAPLVNNRIGRLIDLARRAGTETDAASLIERLSDRHPNP